MGSKYKPYVIDLYKGGILRLVRDNRLCNYLKFVMGSGDIY